MVPPAFTSQESGEVNKQVLVFNCGPLIALPSSVLECSAPPFTVHLPAALITSCSNSLSQHQLSFCLSPLSNSFAIHFFLNVSASAFFIDVSGRGL